MIKSYNEIVIPSEINNLPLVQKCIEDICFQYNAADYIGIVSVVVLAAVENAIKYGNGLDIRKQVRVAYFFRDAKIVFRVEDEGKGFDYENCISKSIQNGEGKGLFLMKKLCNSFNFLGDGNIVELHFSTTPMKAHTSIERIKAMIQYFMEWKKSAAI